LVGGVAAAIAFGGRACLADAVFAAPGGRACRNILHHGLLRRACRIRYQRNRGVKDWGHMIEGHGGMLDRADSLVFSAPVFFHIVRYFWT
jgi:phosphatidate cytidylyltransferase